MKNIFCSSGCGPQRATFRQRFYVVLLSALLAGCSDQKTPVANGGNTTPAPPTNSNKITIKGSNTIGEELAPKLIGEFKKDHASIDFELVPKRTGYGVASLMDGDCDLAGASRTMIDAEQERAKGLGMEFNEYVIGSYSVAVVVNSANPVSNLTTNQVRDIFTGVVKNWKEVGGPDAPIKLYVRDLISGTYYGFNELAMEGKPYAAEPKMSRNYVDLIGAVAQDPNGIGYSSINLCTKPGVKGVAIGGVAPTTETVNKGQYPYARVLRYFANKAKDSGPAHEFVQFVVSPKGQEVVSQMGFTPHP